MFFRVKNVLQIYKIIGKKMPFLEKYFTSFSTIEVLCLLTISYTKHRNKGVFSE